MTVHRNKILFVVFVQLFLIHFISANQNTHENTNPKFRHLTINDGLSQSTVTAIAQDKNGFLWFGTQDGLNRYDGYRFTVYKNRKNNPNSLSHNWIRDIIVDSSGLLWIGTLKGGLNRFDPVTDTFTIYKHNETDRYSISSNIVLSLYEDRHGILWVGTRYGGLNMFDKKSGRFYQYKRNTSGRHSLSYDSVTAIYEDRDGFLWVGTRSGLNKFDRKTGSFTHFFHDPKNPNSLCSDSISTICEDNLGYLWVGTMDGGLNRISSNREVITHYGNPASDSLGIHCKVVSITAKDRDGSIWVGTGNINFPGTGIYKIAIDEKTNTLTFHNYMHNRGNPSSINDNSVMSIYEDKAGTLWFGTLLNGINKLNRVTKKFRHYTVDPDSYSGLNDKMISAFMEDPDGILWIGTQSGGLNRFDKKKNRFTHYKNDSNDPNSLGNNSVLAIYRDSRSDLWIGTGRDGLNKFDPRTGHFSHFTIEPDVPDGISGNSVTAILEDSDMQFWVGTWGGLKLFDRDTKTYFNLPISGKQTSNDSKNSMDHRLIVFSIIQDRAKRIWVGTYGNGLFKLVKRNADPVPKDIPVSLKALVNYTNNTHHDNKISSNNVYGLHEDRQGFIWIATDAGLNKWDENTDRFTCFSPDNPGGDGDSLFYGIIEDDTGKLWLSSTNGLLTFDPKTSIWKKYNVDDGLQGNEFNLGACYKNQNGEIYFGGTNGFNVFFPKDIKENPHKPPVIITHIRVFDKDLEFHRPVNQVKEMTLSYKENYFSFEFSALDFVCPAKNKYAYKLEGFDKEWIYCGTRRYAGYTNLDGGMYLFKVKGCNNDGVWNETGTSIKIHITPPPWETWWFILLVTILLLGIFFWLHRIRTTIIRHRLKKQQLTERLNLKKDFTAMLVHDLRNPLQCISGYIEILDSMENPGIEKIMGIIRQSSNTMLSLINDMLDISKFEAGKMPLHKETVRLGEIIENDLLLMKPLLKKKEIRLTVDLHELPPVNVDPIRIGQVINNLLGNAVKFSPEGGAITISLSGVMKAGVSSQEVRIADEGPGVSEELQARLFNKYVQKEDRSHSRRKGTGLGLVVSKFIVDSHGGHIGCRKGKKKGSVFYFSLPNE